MDFELAKRVLVVTGAASGIGLAVAEEARRGGMRVALVDTNRELASAAVQRLDPEGRDCMLEVFDVRDSAACDAAIRHIEEMMGPIDALVACAGIARAEPATDMSDASWEAVLDVNLSGVFRTARSVGRGMVSRGRGSMVLIASTDAFGGHAARSNYAASKHGVVGLARSLAIEWGRHGVRVNVVAPGVVDTPLLRSNLPPDHVANAMVDRIPMGRLSAAEEQARACLFLLSDAASYINGATLAVDGGLTAGYYTRWSGADLGSNSLLERGLYHKPAGAA